MRGLYHRPDPRVPFAEGIEALRDLVDSGVVHLAGISNVNVDQIRLAHSILGDRLVAVQNQYSPAFRTSQDELRYTTELGLSFLPYSPLGGIARAGDGCGGKDPVDPSAQGIHRGPDDRRGEPPTRYGVRKPTTWCRSCAKGWSPKGSARPSSVMPPSVRGIQPAAMGRRMSTMAGPRPPASLAMTFYQICSTTPIVYQPAGTPRGSGGDTWRMSSGST
ncbi:aldo/keto reductase [Mycobacteroides stephanolepidis]|uniref:aldo/keto reductase n=1 Tax=[Mycobacterium] stephanolepidis TaxID=1520670 RepID=UPI0013905499